MDVDDLVFPAPDEIGREDFHEPGEDDEIDLMLLFEYREPLLNSQPPNFADNIADHHDSHIQDIRLSNRHSNFAANISSSIIRRTRLTYYFVSHLA